jgi:ketosteroid isomerase-like protein
MAAWSAVRIDDVASEDGPGDSAWKPLRHHLGIRAFGLNAWVADHAGQELVEEHDEVDGNAGGHEEVYVITRGRATFTVDGETVAAPEGTIVHVADPRIVRSAVADEPRTTVLCVGAEPGKAFEPSEWELRRVA